MTTRYSVSIVLSTYNRHEQLRPAIEHLLAQASDSPPYEVIVVDNNSTDITRRVVEACIAGAGGRLRYLFEPRQGVSFARNTGVDARRPLSLAGANLAVRKAVFGRIGFFAT